MPYESGSSSRTSTRLGFLMMLIATVFMVGYLTIWLGTEVTRLSAEVRRQEVELLAASRQQSELLRSMKQMLVASSDAASSAKRRERVSVAPPPSTSTQKPAPDQLQLQQPRHLYLGGQKTLCTVTQSGVLRKVYVSSIDTSMTPVVCLGPDAWMPAIESYLSRVTAASPTRSIFVEFGAKSGYFTQLLAYRALRSQSTVMAIESNPVLFRLLEDGLDLMDYDTSIVRATHGALISSSRGQEESPLPPISSSSNSSTSIYAENATASTSSPPSSSVTSSSEKQVDVCSMKQDPGITLRMHRPSKSHIEHCHGGDIHSVPAVSASTWLHDAFTKIFLLYIDTHSLDALTHLWMDVESLMKEHMWRIPRIVFALHYNPSLEDSNSAVGYQHIVGSFQRFYDAVGLVDSKGNCILSANLDTSKWNAREDIYVCLQWHKSQPRETLFQSTTAAATAAIHANPSTHQSSLSLNASHIALISPSSTTSHPLHVKKNNNKQISLPPQSPTATGQFARRSWFRMK